MLMYEYDHLPHKQQVRISFECANETKTEAPLVVRLSIGLTPATTKSRCFSSTKCSTGSNQRNEMTKNTEKKKKRKKMNNTFPQGRTEAKNRNKLTTISDTKISNKYLLLIFFYYLPVRVCISVIQ